MQSIVSYMHGECTIESPEYVHIHGEYTIESPEYVHIHGECTIESPEYVHIHGESKIERGVKQQPFNIEEEYVFSLNKLIHLVRFCT